jgi:hypothetical protein
MNLSGTWNLEVSTPFGKHPATLVFERDGDGALNGRIDSRLGNAPLLNLSTTDDGFDALVTMDFQGRGYEATIGGLADGDRIEGTIKVKLPIAPPLKFTGTRADS